MLDDEELDADGVITLVPGERFDESVMRVNTSHDRILENIRTNIRRHIAQAGPAPGNPQRVCLVGGGWSLADPAVFKELRRLYFDGCPLVALNGSANWLLERNMRPALHVILDARPENAAFIPPEPVPRCFTYLASQCDPATFDAARDREPTIFHGLGEQGETPDEHAVLDEYYGARIDEAGRVHRRWMRVPACGTVGVTGILLLRVLGFRNQDLFGLDSCCRVDGEHHAFSQPLNEHDRDGSALFQVGKSGRVFRCSAWQAAQARTFIKMLHMNGEHLELNVHGDGLLAYLLEVAADQAERLTFKGSLPGSRAIKSEGV